MANEEKMNVDVENQEDFAKKKKIIVISLSVGLVFITLIAGLFLAKKNKESRENNDIGEVVDEDHADHENNDDNDHENDDVIVNEGDYFFNKTSGQVTTNVLLSLITGILFFLWENDKLPKEGLNGKLWEGCNGEFLACGCDDDDVNVYRGNEGYPGTGIFEKLNWFGFASLGFLIGITFLVELVLCLLLGSISHFFSKDKNKRYFRTLAMFLKKRKKLFSFSKTKTFFIVLSYLLGGFVIAVVARTISKKLNLCCECWNVDGEIVHEHGIHYCLGYCKDGECCPSGEATD